MARSRRWTKARCRVRRSFDYHGMSWTRQASSSTHVTGVRVGDRVVGAEQDLAESLIVDATGCGSRTPAFSSASAMGARSLLRTRRRCVHALQLSAPRSTCCSPLIATRCFRCTAAEGTTSSDALAEGIGGRLALVQNEFHLPGHARRS
ncbi:MAG: hypothetical protein QOE04_2772, partial [Mycobacterium sp.]|nr:hypothetical protein [Mycobacterium sp.]